MDVIQSSGRRILGNFGEVDARNEGLIILSQNLGKLGVLLPRIAGADRTPDELFQIICKKAGIAPEQNPADYVLYGISSLVYSDF